MTTDEILFGVGLTFVLAVGSQVAASRVRVPALIILLPAGFVAGALTDDVRPDRLLGAAFQSLVSLAVAVILYGSGLGLDLRKLRGRPRRTALGLIVAGVALSRMSTTCCSWCVPAPHVVKVLYMVKGGGVKGRDGDKMTVSDVTPQEVRPVRPGTPDAGDATKARAAAERAVKHNAVTLDALGLRVELPPPDQLAFLAGLGALAALEIVEWPVALVLAVGHQLAHSHHSRVLREFGDALEEA